MFLAGEIMNHPEFVLIRVKMGCKLSKLCATLNLWVRWPEGGKNDKNCNLSKCLKAVYICVYLSILPTTTDCNIVLKDL